jgi:hypothetical protein
VLHQRPGNFAHLGNNLLILNSLHHLSTRKSHLSSRKQGNSCRKDDNSSRKGGNSSRKQGNFNWKDGNSCSQSGKHPRRDLISAVEAEVKA